MYQPTREELLAALKATELPPKEDFERMVSIGLINSEGELTKLFGGDAEPEPWAKRPAAVTSATINGRREQDQSDQDQPIKKRRQRRT